MAKRYSSKRRTTRTRTRVRSRPRRTTRVARRRSPVRRSVRRSGSSTVRIVVEQVSANPIARPELVKAAKSLGGKPKL